MNETQMTLTGNLVEDPELRFTPAGQPVAKFRVASTPRFRDNSTGEWKDGDSLFLTCTVWRQAAENVAESLTRGMRVIVTGRLKQRSYETKEGEKRTVYELEVDEVGPSLRNASAKVAKVARSRRSRRPGPGSRGQQAGRPVGQRGSRRVQRRAAVLACLPPAGWWTPALAPAGAGAPAVPPAGTSCASTLRPGQGDRAPQLGPAARGTGPAPGPGTRSAAPPPASRPPRPQHALRSREDAPSAGPPRCAAGLNPAASEMPTAE